MLNPEENSTVSFKCYFWKWDFITRTEHSLGLEGLLALATGGGIGSPDSSKKLDASYTESTRGRTIGIKYGPIFSSSSFRSIMCDAFKGESVKDTSGKHSDVMDAHWSTKSTIRLIRDSSSWFMVL